MLTLPDLGERQRRIGDDLPRPLPVPELDASLDLLRRLTCIAVPAEQRPVRDVRHRRPRVLREPGALRELDRFARHGLGRGLVLLVERHRGADPQRVDGHGVDAIPLRRPPHRLDDRLGLVRLAHPPQPRREHHLRAERPDRVGRGRGRQRPTRVRDRAADVAAQEPQIRRQRGERARGRLAVARLRRRALGELEPALGLVQVARMRRHHGPGEAEPPIVRRDRLRKRIEPAQPVASCPWPTKNA